MISKIYSRLAGSLPSAVLYFVAGLVLYLVALPIILLMLSGFKPEGLVINPGFTLSYYIELYSSSETYELLLNTIVFAAGSTVVALCFSIFLAWTVERTNIGHKGLLRALIIAPMGVSPMLSAMGWVLLASPKIGFFNTILKSVFNLSEAPLNIYSLPGMIFVQGMTAVPSSFLLLCFTFRNMDPVFEDASAVSGIGVFGTLRRVVLPILRPGLLSVSILTFIVSMSVFDVAGVIGMPANIEVLSIKLYWAVQDPQGIPDFGAASSLATLFFICILILSYVYNRQTKTVAKFSTITGREFKPKILDLRNWKYAVIAVIGCYLLLATGLPMAILVWQSFCPYYAPVSLDMLESFSLNNFRSLFAYPRMMLAIKNTLIVACISATVLAFLATIVSWIIVRSKYRWRRILDMITMLPMSMPHMMLGLALIYVYLTVRVGIYGTIWIIVIAFVTAYMTYATRLINSTMFQINKELEEAAEVSGASMFKMFRTIILPLLVPSMIGLWVWVVVHVMRELSLALMLQSHKNFVLTTLIWHMWDQGDIPQLAIIGIGMTVFLFVIMMAGHAISRLFDMVRE